MTGANQGLLEKERPTETVPICETSLLPQSFCQLAPINTGHETGAGGN